MPFPDAIFGPASYALPVHLDMVDCRGAENQLSNCNHTRTTSCLHSEDASVDCLGRTIGTEYCYTICQFAPLKYHFFIHEVGKPCFNEESVRLVGGMDQFQGRVEICSSGIYSAVCHNRWDVQDAQVICRQLSLLSKPTHQVYEVFSCRIIHVFINPRFQ